LPKGSFTVTGWPAPGVTVSSYSLGAPGPTLKVIFRWLHCPAGSSACVLPPALTLPSGLMVTLGPTLKVPGALSW